MIRYVLAVRYLELRGVVKVVVRRGVRIEDECLHKVERANECVSKRGEAEAEMLRRCPSHCRSIVSLQPVESREC